MSVGTSKAHLLSAKSQARTRTQNTQVRPLSLTGPLLEPEPAFLAITNPPQGQPGQQASGLQVVFPISESPSQRVPQIGVRPQGALGRAVWTEAAMMCQAACATSLHGAGVRVRGGPESFPASGSCQGWRRQEDFPAK